MAKNKSKADPIETLVDLVKKLLALELFNSGISKKNIRIKLRMNATESGKFLKGLNKKSLQ